MQISLLASERYRRRAADLRREADKLRLPITRQMLLEVAGAYERLATMADARTYSASR